VPDILALHLFVYLNQHVVRHVVMPDDLHDGKASASSYWRVNGAALAGQFFMLVLRAAPQRCDRVFLPSRSFG
jgi:hypothetical protein